MNEKNIILSLQNISKKFGSTVALKDVTVNFEKGKVTSIYGPNGAGKSTLIKIIVGEEKADNGDIFINGNKTTFKNYSDALKNGISYVPQDFGLLNNLTVLENIGVLYNQLNNRITYSEKQLISHFQNHKSTDLPFPELNSKVEELTTFEKQLLATHKALLINSEIIIFDESTTNLNNIGFDKFSRIIKKLKEKGKTIIFISHKINEVFVISDNLIVLKEGNIIEQKNIENFNKSEITKQYNLSFEKTTNNTYNSNEVLVSVEKDEIIKQGFEIHKGEIIAIETKNTKLKQNIGYHIFNKLTNRYNIKVGIIPSSRDEEAIFPNMNIKDNLMINAYSKNNYNDINSQKKMINSIANELKLVFRDWKQSINELSGGNKQKIIFGRWILSNFDLLILIEPTAGIDIETKNILHQKILELKNKGKSFLLITSDEGEQNVLNDRIILLN